MDQRLWIRTYRVAFAVLAFAALVGKYVHDVDGFARYLSKFTIQGNAIGMVVLLACRSAASCAAATAGGCRASASASSRTSGPSGSSRIRRRERCRNRRRVGTGPGDYRTCKRHKRTSRHQRRRNAGCARE